MLTSNGIIMVWLWIFVLLFHVTNGEDVEVFRVKRVDKKCCLTVNEMVMFNLNVEKCYTTYQLNRKCVQKTIYRVYSPAQYLQVL